MAIHVFLKQATTDGSLAELFSDGADPNVQEAGIAALGGKVLFQAAVTGSYDYVLVAELPDHVAVASVCLQCNQRGVKTTALRAYSSHEASKALSSAVSIAQSPE
jgi:uncharacterized protein with GYD domain